MVIGQIWVVWWLPEVASICLQLSHIGQTASFVIQPQAASIKDDYPQSFVLNKSWTVLKLTNNSYIQLHQYESEIKKKIQIYHS